MVLVVDLISCGFVVVAAGLRAAVSVCLPVCFWWCGFCVFGFGLLCIVFVVFFGLVGSLVCFIVILLCGLGLGGSGGVVFGGATLFCGTVLWQCVVAVPVWIDVCV